MALTPTEEALVRQLLDQQAAILSLAGNEATITSKLGATKVTLSDLAAASSVGDADLFLTRQGVTDKSVTGQVLKTLLSDFVQLGTGAINRTLTDKNREFVSVQDYGASPSASAVTNDDAFEKALTYCKSSGKGLSIPSGNYLLSADGVNFAAQGLSIVGIGKPTLTFTGSGKGFILDTELADGVAWGDMRVENLRIIGGPSVTDGFYSRGIVRSVFRNLEVRECSAKAFHILHGVSNQYDSIKYSGNEASQTTRPTYGIYLTNNGAGYYTADCTFVNPISEDFPLGLGCYVHDGSGNVFLGGTFEGCNIGLTVNVGCRRNHFINLWCEANVTRDIEVNSTANTFDDCYFGSSSSGPNIEVTTGKGTIFRGGYLRTANLQSASSDTLFIGCGLDQNLSATLGITGTGTYRILSATKIDSSGNVVGNMEDILGPVKAVRFAPLQIPSSDPNTLDDYEENDWLPVVAVGSGSITVNPTLTKGKYTKVGRLVTLTALIYVDSVSTPSGPFSITSLPFPVASGYGFRSAGSVFATDLAASAVGQITCFVTDNSGTLYFKKYSAGSTSEIGSDIIANSSLTISLTYMTN